jgi:hypothetical protein
MEKGTEENVTLPHFSCVKRLRVETIESSFQIFDQRIAEANDMGLQSLVFGSGTDILHHPQNQSSE